ncbi:aldehyde dehydrogenase (NAD+) [Arthrobacter sp. AG258]|uniref:aldehyde dehydrogenase family protein n=1 Tax=Arthrobacter sp. AG258 TaxID=2183899 RepID=UPI00105CAC8D|nr:aldehyde dehydrogenase family protein [Arthrobacter sp. AG258]TDT79521.1 aldehyde dehydrogenase (NAD+) [Arthrobacter sp. AG258]
MDLKTGMLFINGEWIAGNSKMSISVENPATGELVGTVAEADIVDVDKAVASARAALLSWQESTVEDRAAILEAVCVALEKHSEDLARTITSELGAPIRLSASLHAALPIRDIRATAMALRDVPFETEIGNSLVRSIPVGVVGAITPWNYPLHQVVSKVVPAIAAGCTVVLKPSDLTPFTALSLAEIMSEAGLPDGVLNVITGRGSVVGNALVAHPGVDAISFTGSEEVGRIIARDAAENFKRVTLELGGKSANVILDDADVSTAVKVGVANCFLNTGQSCNALTRMIVPMDILDSVEELAAAAAAKYVPGDPLDGGTRMGPVVSARQQERIVAAINEGIASGAKLIFGGPEVPAGPGYYVQPTIFSNVDEDSSLAQEEIFGPVLSIIGFRDEAEAIRIANNSRFGLGGAVWSRDEDRAHRVARAIRTGQVDINGAAFNPAAPFGGFKHSGYGRELGSWGISEFLEHQSIQR